MAYVDTVRYIDPFSDVSISYDGKNFETTLNKKSTIGSRVSYSDVILHSFKVPSTMSDDVLKTHAEIKMYDDAGLDLQKKYKIIYSKKELDFEENILIEAFAIDINQIKESLKYVLRHTNHVDFLALPFLSFSTLYKNKIIEPKNDIFIYIDDEETFLSIYKDGKYLSTKSLTNLNELLKKLNGAGIEMSMKELKEHLAIKGLDSSAYERGEVTLYNEIESTFAGIFSKINDIVVYNRSIFGFENIDRIFLSMQDGRIKGVREFIKNFGFEDVEVLDFNVFRNKDEGMFFEKIVASYIYDKIESNDFSHNVTIFVKETPFYKKESGKIMLFASFVILASLLYAAFVLYENSELEKQRVALKVHYDAMKKSEARYKKKLGLLGTELKSVSDTKKNMDKKLKNIESSITTLETLLLQKRGYSSFIFDVNKLLKKHKLSTTNITIDGKNSMSIEIVAEYVKRDSISKFMEDLIAAGFIGISTDEIKYDKDIYMSKIEIKK